MLRFSYKCKSTVLLHILILLIFANYCECSDGVVVTEAILRCRFMNYLYPNNNFAVDLIFYKTHCIIDNTYIGLVTGLFLNIKLFVCSNFFI